MTGKGTTLPTICPHCGSEDTSDRFGDGSAVECIACEAFWYFCAPPGTPAAGGPLGTWESVPGSVRESANREYAAAVDRELFGD